MAAQVGMSLKRRCFTLVLGGLPAIPDEASDKEFDARMADLMDETAGRVLAVGCDDATLVARGQTFSLGFDREAESLGDAIGSAVKAVERAGFAVARVEVEADPAADRSA